jgi:primosomal protein N' (replication factor Y)
VPLAKCFDYLAPDGVQEMLLQPGMRVKVPFGRRHLIGLLISVGTQSMLPQAELKKAVAILDEEPLFSSFLLKLIEWASDYYHYPIGEVCASALPSLLRQGKAADYGRKKLKNIVATISSQPLQLNKAQENAIKMIAQAFNTFSTFLLEGVTGSGKTEVYLQLAEILIKNNQQLLVLVPEIGLTPQIVTRFERRFALPIAVLHSGLNDRQRLNAWLAAKEGKVSIIIGTRSAIFVPLPRLGAIIVDEEHDLSFKQQEGFRYCARDLAIKRGSLENIPVLLGTATPSLESFFNAEQKRYTFLALPERAGNAQSPGFHFLDLRGQHLENGISKKLLLRIQAHLNQPAGQVLLFLNRRGFSPLLICHACGWMAACQRCDAKMTLHQNPLQLQCHHCGAQHMVVSQCPSCKETQVKPLGMGTQRLEETLMQYFPGVNIARLDRDNTKRKGSLQSLLASIQTGDSRILLGTQMLAKGHHFPNVTLVAILDADNGLFSSDFRASERMAQLLIQVGGRAGRGERSGEVVIQTYHPEHVLLQILVTQGYKSFAQLALKERRMAALPPYTHWAILRAEAMHQAYPNIFLKHVADLGREFCSTDVTCSGPVPSLMERKAGRYRAQLLMQANNRGALHAFLTKLLQQIQTIPLIKRVRWSLDVDPYELT